MSYTDKNKIEQLEQKVAQLERKLEQMSSKEEIIRDIENRLTVYDDTIRSDKGEVMLKKNLVMENRKAIDVQSIDGILDPATDNTFTLYFNDSQGGRLNHMFLGTASAKGFYNTSLISSEAVIKENIPDVNYLGENYTNPHNGMIRWKLYNQKYFKNGMPDVESPDGEQPNLIVANRELFDGQKGIEGVVSQLVGTGKNPYASIGVSVEDSGTFATFVACDKNYIYLEGVPTSNPDVAGAIWRDGTTLKISTG